MNQILIQNVLLKGQRTDVLIEGNCFKTIRPGIAADDAAVIDGTQFAVIPPFYNTHTHAAMTLLRGYADDLKLFDWLNLHIWPAEAKLAPEDIYWGSKLAILEMIKTGTVFFSDMYFMQHETIRAAEEMGVRAAVGLITLESVPDLAKMLESVNDLIWESRRSFSGRISLTLAPHAIYTVSTATLEKIAERSRNDQMMIHTHLAETQFEVAECRQKHGCSPVEYLARVGLLTDRAVLAHAIHLSDRDIELVAQAGASVNHNPCSNMKLASGVFPFEKMLKAKINITLGTDGCASNNNLSMLEEMKFAALLAKSADADPESGHMHDVFNTATVNGARAFGIDAGVIEAGKLADCVLVDLDNSLMVGDYHLTSNLVYSADSSCIDTVICDGKILMRHRQVPGEKEIIAAARKCCDKFRK